MDAPNVMSLIKDTKAAQEVPSKSKQCTFFTFPFGPAPPAEYFPCSVYLSSIESGTCFVYLSSTEPGISFILCFPSGSSYEGFLRHAFKCQFLFLRSFCLPCLYLWLECRNPILNSVEN